MFILRITLGKIIAFFCLPQVFCDPKICQKTFLTGAAPRIPLDHHLWPLPTPGAPAALGWLRPWSEKVRKSKADH